MHFTSDDITAVANKLKSLDLTENERGALAAMLDHGDDVEGFGWDEGVAAAVGERTGNNDVHFNLLGELRKAQLGVIVWCKEFN